MPNFEKFNPIEEQEKQYNGVHLEVLEKLEAENPELKDDLKDVVGDLEEKIYDYAKMVHNMENAISVAKFRMNDNEYTDYVSNLDKSRHYRHMAIQDLLNIVSRISKDRGWRESWGTIGSSSEYDNISRWAVENGDYLKQQDKNKG
jgi:uncharacterized protein (UPF0335 family)